MTAEIAVMNKEAIALAADSAVTMRDESGEKVFPSANKIFSLSKYEPVAAMIFGNANFIGIPWEPALKLFRKELGATKYATIARYGEELLQWLKGHRGLFPETHCDTFCCDHVEYVFGILHEESESAAAAIKASPDAMFNKIVGLYYKF